MNLNAESNGPLKRFPREFARFGALALLALVLGAVLPASVAFGDSTQDQIDAANAQIAQLEKEISQYQDQLAQVGQQKNTLQNQINQLDISRKKMSADITVTQTKINQTNLQIKQLTGSIGDKEEHITKNNTAIERSLVAAYQLDQNTLFEQLLSAESLESAWEEVDRLAALETSLQDQIKDLANTKMALESDRTDAQKKQAQLSSLKKDLTGQKLALDQARADQAKLLSDTKDKESNYQAIINQKTAAKAAFEKQLADYESQLKFNLDPNVIPKAGTGVFIFPVDPVFMARCPAQKNIFGNIYCVTQYFGNTAFAQSGAYNGKGHNGIDIGVPQGTKIVAPLSGTVMATGNTDLQKGCYSYGKWVLLQHDDGLATIYGHLSVISVNAGDRLGTGDLIGYSGKTGYATGPHLHFGVYVGSAVKVVRYGDVVKQTNCGNVNMPVAPTEAYLNPMSYL